MTPTATKVNEKNSDKSHGSTGMFPHQFGRFFPLVTHLPSENSIPSNFSSPRGVAILGCESHSQAGSASLGVLREAPQWESWRRRSTDLFSTLLYYISQVIWPGIEIYDRHRNPNIHIREIIWRSFLFQITSEL